MHIQVLNGFFTMLQNIPTHCKMEKCVFMSSFFYTMLIEANDKVTFGIYPSAFPPPEEVQQAIKKINYQRVQSWTLDKQNRRFPDVFTTQKVKIVVVVVVVGTKIVLYFGSIDSIYK